MTDSMHNPLGTRTTLDTPDGTAHAYALESLEKAGLGSISRMPYSIKVLLEAVVRNCDGETVTEDDIKTLAGWQPSNPGNGEVPFLPARVILQDFTGVPAVVDLAAMRSTLERLGGDPERINPAVPVDLVIDHSVQVDVFGTPLALSRNAEIEFARNRERYEFLRWGKNAFDGFRVVPPATGIVHQVNLEFLATVVMKAEKNGETFLFPDSLVGTDSHTTMINGLGVLGWGVGGIEAEAGMLGQPSYLIMPEVIGFKMHGQLREGVTATDLVLVVVQMLRKKGVVEKFVEFYGQGLSQMSLPDRATVANMAPEYGATMGFFPVDEETLRFLRRTGRSDDLVARVEAYTKMQGLFRTDEAADPEFTDTLELDLATVEPSLAGPKTPARPHRAFGYEGRVPIGANHLAKRARLRAVFRRAFADRDRGLQRHTRKCRPRRRGHCRDYLLHEHFESLGDVGRGAARQESDGARAQSAALREDLARAGLESRDRVLARSRPSRFARRSRVSPRRLWLHDLHRQ